MKKILFVIPKIFADYPGALNPHLGIAYMTALLDKNNIPSDVFDMQLGYSFKELLEKIKNTKPDLIGVSLFSFDYRNSYKLINQIKEKTDLPIILGGCHVSSFMADVLKDTNADIAVYGEAENTLVEICQDKKLHEIKGLMYKDNGEIKVNAPQPLVQNLDSLPFPNYDKFELEKYNLTIDKRLPVATSRGCPYKCNYCSANLTVGRLFRARSPENILNELEYWVKRGFNNFEIIDDCFNFDMDRAKKICDLIIERGLKIKWRCGSGIRADRVDEELLEKMKKAGCVYLAYGLESGDPEILHRMKKAITLKQALKSFKLTQKAKIPFSINFIIGHADETYEKAMRSIELAEKISEAIPEAYVNFHNMIPFPGTELYSYVKEHGKFILPEDQVLTEAATLSGDPLFETPEFTFEERKKVLRLGLKLTRKTHLRVRFGIWKGFLIYYLLGGEKLYSFGRKMVMGTSLGRKMFNAVKVT